MSNKLKRQLARKTVVEARKPISLDMNTAIGSLLTSAVQNDAVKIAASVICDERKLKGEWAVQVTAAQLVPVTKVQSPEPEKD